MILVTLCWATQVRYSTNPPLDYGGDQMPFGQMGFDPKLEHPL